MDKIIIIYIYKAMLFAIIPMIFDFNFFYSLNLLGLTPIFFLNCAEK